MRYARFHLPEQISLKPSNRFQVTLMSEGLFTTILGISLASYLLPGFHKVSGFLHTMIPFSVYSLFLVGVVSSKSRYDRAFLEAMLKYDLSYSYTSLIGLAEYRIIVWKYLLQILRTLFHCLLAYSVAVEKSQIYFHCALSLPLFLLHLLLPFNILKYYDAVSWGESVLIHYSGHLVTLLLWKLTHYYSGIILKLLHWYFDAFLLHGMLSFKPETSWTSPLILSFLYCFHVWISALVSWWFPQIYDMNFFLPLLSYFQCPRFSFS